MIKDQEIIELKNKIKEASIAYGNAEPIMSDKEFDSLVNRMKKLDPTYIDTVTYGDHVDGFQKAKHNLITGTLAKCKDEAEFKTWFKNHPGTYMMELKQDGISLECKYVGGILVEAVTRGTGFEGDVVTDNAKKVADVKQSIDKSFTGSIRGEIQMSKTTFNEKYSETMKNSRNAAAGIMKHKDGAECENLDFIAYDLQEEGEKTIKTEQAKLDFLENNGFKIPAYKLIKTLDEAFEFRTSTYENRENLEYDIDGVVVKPEVIDYEDLKNRTPKKSCAIKFELDTAISEVIDIQWSMKGSYLTPIAIINPVELDGTTVQKVSCSNVNWLIEKGVEIGKKVVVVKRGQIIPHIEGLAE